MKGPFLEFDKLEPPVRERRITGIWSVRAAKSREFLGVIQWYAAWRRYTFCTKAAEMAFDYACLSEITRFISEQMEARKDRP